jgi:DNA-binding CsgD family transcriptional regulator
MAPAPADAPFVGRSAHLDRLGELLDAAAGGGPCGVLVGGDAGVGKTRLVGELTALAGARGFLVLTGRSVDLGAGGLPYLPFVDALRSALRAGGAGADVVRHATSQWPVLLHLAGRAAEGGPLDDADRLPLFDAAASVLARLADEVAPVVLVLEDLHWADASTRDLLRFLLSRLQAERLLVAVTFRTDDLHRRHPLRPLLAELVRLPGVERLDLAPFDRAELAGLLRTVTGADLPADVVLDIARRSGGNAFFALELLAARVPEVGSSAGSGVRVDLGQLPDALSDVLLTRLEGLSAPAQHVVRTAAVGGRCVSDRLLRAVVAGISPASDLDAALREAADRHVLVADGPDRYSFRHALLQEAVYADLLPGERVRLHAAYATGLAGEFADSGGGADADLAEHALRSHDLAGALAASWRAARAAQAQLAPLDALEHAERALGLWEAVPAERRPDDGDHVDLLLLAASAAALAGEFSRAEALATVARDEAIAGGDPVRVAHARRHLARHLYAGERLDACLEEARLARETLLALPPSADLVWATATMASAAGSAGDLDAMVALATSGLELARTLGLAAAEADLLVTLAIAGGDGALATLAEARDRARVAGAPAIEVRALWNMGLTRHEADDLVEARGMYRDVQARGQQTGLAASLYVVGARISLVEVLYRLGEWDEAVSVARADGVRLGQVDSTSLEVAALRVPVARDPESARAAGRRIRDAGHDPRRIDSFTDASLSILLAEAALWCGEPEAAVAEIVEALERLDARYPAHLVSVRVVAAGLAAIAAGGRPGGGRELADSWLARVEAAVAGARPMRSPTVGPEARAWLARARALHARAVAGAPTVAELPHWSAALELAGGQPYEQAQVRFGFAEALLAQDRRDPGERGRAVEAAAAAHAVAAALGARPLRVAVETLGRRARLDLGAGVPGPSGPLTPREAQVLHLVAAGLTNRVIGERLFISEKTASVHVSNILGKLGASGRAEAVAIAGRRGLLAADGGREAGP